MSGVGFKMASCRSAWWARYRRAVELGVLGPVMFVRDGEGGAQLLAVNRAEAWLPAGQ
jgi:hypothetical protein